MSWAEMSWADVSRDLAVPVDPPVPASLLPASLLP